MDSDEELPNSPTTTPRMARQLRSKISKSSIAKIPCTKKGLRTGFTIKKDITLLRSVVSQNPYQLGDEIWGSVLKDFQDKYPNHGSSTTRTIRNRIDRLIQQYQSQEFKSKTGTEEERTERATLLEEIITIKAQEDVSIVKVIDAEADTTSNDQNITFTQEELDEAVSATKPSQLKRKADKKKADDERDFISEDFHSNKPSKKTKINFEEKLIKERQEHEIRMEERRLKMEEQRLELEKAKEARLAEENKRRDLIATEQVGIQKMMLKLMETFADKKDKTN